MEKANCRIPALDEARILAVLAVVVLHTSGDFVLSDMASKEFFFGNITDSISRAGVPMFLMISGALMLDERREITFRDVLTKKIKNLVCLTALWSLFFAVVSQILKPLASGSPVSLSAFVHSFFTGHYHMWFLYMIIGIYLITPFLRCFVRFENRHMVLFFIGAGLVASFTEPLFSALSAACPPLCEVSTFIEQFQLDFFCGYTIYYLTGWYIVRVGFRKRATTYILSIAGLLSLLTTILYVQFTGDIINGYSNMNLLIFLYAVGAFCTLVNRKADYTPRKKYLLTLFSQLTFGVYIIHPLLLNIFQILLPFTDYPLLQICLTFLFTSAFSFVICYFASKNAVSGWMIRCHCAAPDMI